MYITYFISITVYFKMYTQTYKKMERVTVNFINIENLFNILYNCDKCSSSSKCNMQRGRLFSTTQSSAEI